MNRGVVAAEKNEEVDCRRAHTLFRRENERGELKLELMTTSGTRNKAPRRMIDHDKLFLQPGYPINLGCLL